MKSHYFVATLTAHIELSNEQFELLFDEAAKHYDFKVKSSTQVGGFLFGFRNRRTFANEGGREDNIVEFSEHQLGLMMKAMEMNYSEAGMKLMERILGIFKDLQRQTVQVNKPLNDIKFIGQFTSD